MKDIATVKIARTGEKLVETTYWTLDHPWLYVLVTIVVISAVIAACYGLSMLSDWSNAEWEKTGVNFARAMGR
jgi:tellurite resistance protein